MLSPNLVACRERHIALQPINGPGDPITDSALLQRIARGDQHAMRSLFIRHRHQAFRFILRLTKYEALAEDILIETFFDVWRFADRFEGRSKFSTWLLAIARNKALAVHRQPSMLELDDHLATSIPDPADDPERTAQRKDVQKTLRRCLANLTARHTEVIDLVYYHGKTVAEVAEILNLPEATVKTRMFYARRKLAQLVHATGCNNLL
jgi:RNA polymerase sigma-70 factor, ECF subfamily